MAMHPMSPKRIPTPTAFKLLAELEEFFAHPAKERREAVKDYFDAYMKADVERETALATIAKEIEAARLDRADAKDSKFNATGVARATVMEAEGKAKIIVDAATEQAASVTETARKAVADANDHAEAARAEALMRTDGLAEAEAAVKVREQDVAVREQMALSAITQAEKSKAEYDGLMRDINALRSRAPR